MSKERGASGNLYSRFGLRCVLQTWWLCAAMRLCYHTIELHPQRTPSFFFFFFNPGSGSRDNRTKETRLLSAVVRHFELRDWTGILTAELHDC